MQIALLEPSLGPSFDLTWAILEVSWFIVGFFCGLKNNYEETNNTPYHYSKNCTTLMGRDVLGP